MTTKPAKGDVEPRREAGIRSGPWASSMVGHDPQATMKELQKVFIVGLIATKRKELETCQQDEALPAVVERTRINMFDFLPVVEAKPADAEPYAKIIGLVEVASFRQGEVPDSDIRSFMHPLSDENLIGADANILDFVRNADRQRCRLLVSGLEISGLVSLSDLQRLPVRAALFGLVTHFEIIMTNAIRREFNGAEGWLARLSIERQSQIEEKISNAKLMDGFVDNLLFTQFGDKETIIRKSPFFKLNKTAFKSELAAIQSLRNALAHANDYASSRGAASGTCRTVRLIEQWSKTLSVWPGE